MKTPSLRLITSSFIVFGLMAAVAGLSNALFADSVTIQNSTFATGTAELKIAADDNVLGVTPGTYQDSITGANVTGLVPGESDNSFRFWLRNASSDASVQLAGKALVNDIVGDTDVQANLLIGFTCDVGNDATDLKVVPQKSLDDWEADTTPDADMGTLVAGGTADGTGTDEAYCTMNASLGSGASTQNASATFDVQVTGDQVI